MGENDVLTVLNEEKQKSQQTIIGTNVTEENKQEELLEQRTFLYDALSDEEANRVLKNLKHKMSLVNILLQYIFLFHHFQNILYHILKFDKEYFFNISHFLFQSNVQYNIYF